MRLLPLAKARGIRRNVFDENRGEEYLSRVREERIMLRDLLIEMERLNETVSDGVSKYTTEEPNRPNWLP